MTITDDRGGQAAAAARVVVLGDRRVTIERPRAGTAAAAIAILKNLSRSNRELQSRYAEFLRTYEAEHVVELDRVNARLAFPPRPLVDRDTGQPIREPAELDGEPNPRAGELILIPSPIDRMSEEDWRAVDNVLKRPQSPSPGEIVFALLEHALELGEQDVYRLLALFTLDNRVVKDARRDGTIDARLDERAAEFLDDAFADELLELAVAITETIDYHFRARIDSLGERMGNLRSLFGGPTSRPTTPEGPAPTPSSETESSSRPTSSTDSPPPTDGPPTTSSTPPSTSSSSSDSESSATNSSGKPAMEEAPATA